jgi:hypothetical protein
MSSNRSDDGAFGLRTEATDRRAAALRAEQERAALRQSQIEAQSSPSMSAQERIRLWEDLHGLRLPRDANHKLIGIIAGDTALTPQQVRDEQLRRMDTSSVATSVAT